MKTNKFFNMLARVIMTVTGTILRLCGIIIWIPARIAVGFSEVLEDIGEILTDNAEEMRPAQPVEETIEVEDIVTE
jgi:hypothetical protein